MWMPLSSNLGDASAIMHLAIWREIVFNRMKRTGRSMRESSRRRVSAHFSEIQSRLREAEIATARAEVTAEEERKRRQRNLWTIAGVATLLVITGLVINSIRNSANQRSLRERSRTTVTSLSTSHGILVPRVIEDLQELPSEMVLAELHRQSGVSDEMRKLRLAYGLASLGEVRIDFLVSKVPSVSPDEADNLVQALDRSNRETVPMLDAAAQVAETHEDWRLKSRLAMLALQLGAPGLATDMCQPRPDPIQRSVFIEECSTWHGDLSRLAPVAANIGDGPLRSAIALAIGSVPATGLTDFDRQVWQEVLSELVSGATGCWNAQCGGLGIAPMESQGAHDRRDQAAHGRASLVRQQHRDDHADDSGRKLCSRSGGGYGGGPTGVHSIQVVFAGRP